MIIGIDGNEANVERKVGIGRYAYELLRHFRQFSNSDLQFRVYLKNQPLADMPEESENWKYRVIGPKKLWTRIALPLDLFFHGPRPNVFFTPSHYAPRFSPVPYCMSIMDLSYLKFPELFKKSDLYQLVNWTRTSVSKASRVFTISLASKDDIIREYKIASDKVHVTYPGLNSLSKVKSRMDRGDYILFVGTLQPRKNIERLVEAFSIVKSKYPDLSLFVVGKKGWLYDQILDAPKKFNVSESVKFIDFADDSELSEFYKKAKCFVLPSLYEGFGLPVIEAMQNGCPVIISNVSSLPEAGGDAALYVNPEDSKDIASKIDTLLSDEKLRDQLVKKGYEQVKKFSWEKTAKQTLDVLKQIAK